MAGAKHVKNSKNCAYLGAPGSFSFGALTALYPDAEVTGLSSFREIIGAVQQARFDLAVLPIENSVTGRIPEVHRLLRDMDLAICNEEILLIEHCLIGGAEMTLPRESKGEGLTIFSHRQGFLQSSEYLKKNFPNATLTPETDTSAAIRRVVENPADNIAAIGSEFAAMRYGGKILSRRINNEGENYTRFVFLTHHDNWTPAGDENLTFLSFTVGNEPNALCNALSVLGENSINLVRLEMYGATAKCAEPTFVVDAGVGVKDPVFMKAMKEFEPRVQSIKILGSCIASSERSAESGFLPVR